MAREYHSIYVLLTDTGTVFTRTIRLFTGVQWNHASIAFDRSLRDTYSFGRRLAWNPLSGGFVKEDLTGPLFRSATCALLRCPVTKPQYDCIRRTVLAMEQEAERYKYNLIGLFALPLNVAIEREHAFFCTEFVASVLGRNGVPLCAKQASFVTPRDILQAPVLEPVYEGPLQPLVAGAPDNGGTAAALAV